MARKYTVVEIDGIEYELHGVKADDKKVGFVPVRLFNGAEGPNSFYQFVADADSGETELIIADWKYGNGVRLQGMARKSVTGEGFSDAAFGKIFNDVSIITKDILMQFHGDSAGLKAYCKDIYEKQQANGTDVDEKHVWEELL